MDNERSSKPFKKIDCTRRSFLRMPGNALKIWLYYYTREGKERLAWASEEELCEMTDLNRDTMRKWRNWLVENKWLKLMGHRDAKTGEFAVPIFRVKEGTVAETFSDGRSRNIPPRRSRNLQQPCPPNISVTAAAESFGEEVEPLNQVEPEKQVAPVEVEPIKEGRKEGSISTFQSQKVETPSGSEMRSEEQPQTQEQTIIAKAWVERGGKPFANGDAQHADRLIARFGLGKVYDYIEDTFKCPKTLAVTWWDFSFWAMSLDDEAKPSTKRNIDAWRRVKRIPKPGTHAEKNPELHTGLNAMGIPSMGWDCLLGKVCNGMSATYNEDRICDECKGIPKALAVRGVTRI